METVPEMGMDRPTVTEVIHRCVSITMVVDERVNSVTKLNHTIFNEPNSYGQPLQKVAQRSY